MTELEGSSPRPERKRRKLYQVGQIVEHSYRPPKGKLPENSKWAPLRKHVDKGYVEAWQVVSTLPTVPTPEQLPPQKPPEVTKQERKDAQIDDWHRRTDI